LEHIKYETRLYLLPSGQNRQKKQSEGVHLEPQSLRVPTASGGWS